MLSRSVRCFCATLGGTGALKYAHGQVCFNGQWLSLSDSYGLSHYELRAGNFSEDARGARRVVGTALAVFAPLRRA